jgi:hypothetical protein
MNKLAEQMQSGFRDLKGKVSGFMDNVDWNRVGMGLLKTGSALAVLAIGAAAVVATGGAALPAVMGLFAGTVSAGTAIVTVGTFAAGSAAVAFGFADILEAAQDVGYGTVGSSRASFNPLRDTMFTGNEDLYYGLEMLTTLIASAGTATFRSFNMESEINASEIARYEKNSIFAKGATTNPSAQINGNSYDINKLQKTQSYTYVENVSSIKETIAQSGPNSVPPIKIRVHDGQALVVDGHHRLEAFRQLGYDRVPIKYLHSSQLGKTLPDGTYCRSLQELLDGAKISN